MTEENKTFSIRGFFPILYHIWKFSLLYLIAISVSLFFSYKYLDKIKDKDHREVTLSYVNSYLEIISKTDEFSTPINYTVLADASFPFFQIELRKKMKELCSDIYIERLMFRKNENDKNLLTDNVIFNVTYDLFGNFDKIKDNSDNCITKVTDEINNFFKIKSLKFIKNNLVLAPDLEIVLNNLNFDEDIKIENIKIKKKAFSQADLFMIRNSLNELNSSLISSLVISNDQKQMETLTELKLKTNELLKKNEIILESFVSGSQNFLTGDVTYKPMTFFKKKITPVNIISDYRVYAIFTLFAIFIAYILSLFLEKRIKF